MNTITATSFRENLYQTLAQTENGAPLRITSKKGDCILLSARDWEALEETLYLMGNAQDWKAITEPINVAECTEQLDW